MDTYQTQAFRECVLERFPNIPSDVLEKIVHRESLRVTNQRLSPASYMPLAMASIMGYIRHHLTEYDALLSQQYTRYRALDRVRPAVTLYLNRWSTVS